MNTAFCWDTPVERKARQPLEQALIQGWKLLFNKEYGNGGVSH
ncbi:MULTISPECIES: hypothetical protein [Moorena]|nr:MULTISPECIES: hypothetical protein [Moorena]